MTIYQKIKLAAASQIAVLIDPDKASVQHLKQVAKYCNNGIVDFIFVGGSIVSVSVDEVVQNIKQLTNIPVVLFPGSPLQISYKADAMLFMSLISGRNPELLIGHHVLVAKLLKKSDLEVVSTGYILIGGNKISATEYISNTRAIPPNKVDVIVSTAIAGELLGLKLIYLEAGSGANSYIDAQTITEVKNNLTIPLIVGGGIKNRTDFLSVKSANPNLIVIGTAIEQNPDFLSEIF
ncbi:MAG: geranylgeranylglyceryl/heptaprenylglyceryl phosphate synthase [Bacteroidales bacterium]|nr:geranylgeranylglyceryl/heptaprenylglyceryl phosphate synthase [Bacteroidales bacterium]